MPRRFDPREPLRDSVRLLGLYVRGRILLCFSLAVLYAGGFWAIHVPYWFVIGPLGGMASLIPSVGSLVPVGLAGVAFLTVEAGVGSYLRLLGVWILVLATFRRKIHFLERVHGRIGADNQRRENAL